MTFVRAGNLDQENSLGAASKTNPAVPARADRAALLLAAIVESSDDAIISKDLNGIVTSWNKAAQRIFGWKAEEMIGKSITKLIPPELQDDEPRILAKLRAGERIDHFQTVRMRKDGERLDISLTVSPIRDGNGRIIGAAKIARDITQQKRMEAAVRVSERLASVGRLAATVAHEINNPLEAITNLIYLARHQPELPEKAKQYLDHADHELGRVAHLAKQTLGFYRDNSEATLVYVPRLVDDVLGIYERKFRHKGLKIERRIEDNLTICAMQGELKQVLSNLVANAIDASNQGGRLIVHARRAKHYHTGRSGIRITIADTGTGIDDQNKAKLFAPFFTTKKEVGTGLGLWLTRDLLEKKGGQIRFRSRSVRPSGTAMSIFLPTPLPEASTRLAA